MTSCSCQCHVRGIVGFFHCFDVCCSEPDVIRYESAAEHQAAHPPGPAWETMTEEEKRAWYVKAGMVHSP